MTPDAPVLTRLWTMWGRSLTVMLALAGIGWALRVTVQSETPVGKLQGQIRLADLNKPLEGVRVAIYSSEGFPDQPSRYALTNAQGKFTLSNVAVGTYDITASSRAHHSHDTKISVEEGDTVHLSLDMTRSEPDLKLMQHQRMFDTTERPAFSLTGYVDGSKPWRQDTAHLRLYQTRMSSILQNSEGARKLEQVGSSYDAIPALPPELLHPAPNASAKAVLDRDVRLSATDKEGFYYQKIDFGILPPGLYLADVKHGDDTACGWFLVTDTALVVKRARAQLVAYVANMKTGVPVADCEIRTYRNGKAIDTARTDAHGVAQTRLPSLSEADAANSTSITTVAVRGTDEAVVQHEAYASEKDGQYVVHAYTDRPIYRPGQRIHFKGIVRQRAASTRSNPNTLESSGQTKDARYRVPSQVPVQVELRNPNGDKILDKEFVTSRYGTFAGQADLLKEAPTGSYTLITSIGDEEKTEDITVAAYRKPEFAVTATPDKPRYTRGETVTMTLNGKYFFGAPIVGAKVTYQVYSEMDWAGEYDDASDYDPEDATPVYAHHRSESYYGGSVADGTTTLDANGQATIQFVAQRDKEGHTPDEGTQAQIYTLSATVKEGVDREVEATGTAEVTSGDFRLSVKPEGYVAMPGQPTNVTVTARDYDGKPVPNLPVVLESGYQHWHDSDYEYKTATTQRFTTDANGRATLAVTPPRAGDMVLKAKAFDHAGRGIVARGSLWAASDSSNDLDTTYTDLAVLTDKRQYAPGETARVLINAGRLGQSALLTIEGDHIYRTQVLPLTKHSTLLHVPIPSEFGPNIFLSACYVRDKHFAQSSASLRVSLPASEIHVALTPDRPAPSASASGSPTSTLPRYQPGERVTYDVQTTNAQGQPIACNLSFGTVDEAIYALREDDPKALRDAFYPRRYNQVNTSYSFEVIYMGDADKSEPQIKARRKFEDTAFWQPDLLTDTQGHARVTFTLPDNLTTWRTTVVANSLDTRVGRATDKIIETKDFFVRLQTPRSLTQRDVSQLTAIVHNETDTPQNAHVRLTADLLTLDSGDTQSVALPPHQSASVTWAATAAQFGDANLRVTAWTAPAGGQPRYTDGLETTLPVRAYGREQITSAAGELSQSSKTETLSLDANAVAGASHLTVRLTPSLAGALTGSSDYLIGFPYGCVEQTMSRFLPDLLVQRALRLHGLHDTKRQAELPRMVSEGLQRLYRMQHSSGAWGWWEHDKDDVWMTAYVLYGLATARDNGAEVSANTLRRGREAGVKMLPKSKPQERPFLLYALALCGERDSLTQTRSRFLLSSLTPENLGYVILADAVMGHDTTQAVALLKAKARDDNGMRYWAGDNRFETDSLTATAVALRALLAADPTGAEPERVLRWLMLKRTGDFWISTRDTAWVLAALCDALKTQGTTNSGGSIAVRVNGQTAQTVPLSAKNLREKELSVAVPATLLKAGANTIELARTGGDSPVFYTVQLRQTVASGNSLPPSEAKIAIQRDYLRVLPKQTSASHWELQTEPTHNTLRQGDTIRVRLKLTVPRDMAYVLIEDPFPAGCEVSERGDASDVTDWSYWWSSVDVRDDRIAFFARDLSQGEHVIEYHLRAQTPGQYHVLPTLLQAMYQPDLRGESAESKVVIP